MGLVAATPAGREEGSQEATTEIQPS